MSDITDNEYYYDEVIAPRLLEIANMCKERGIPMMAVVYFDGQNSGLTQTPPLDTLSHPAWLLLHSAWKACGNVDAMCISLEIGMEQSPYGHSADKARNDVYKRHSLLYK